MTGTLNGQLWYVVVGTGNDDIDGHLNSDGTDVTTAYDNLPSTGPGFSSNGSDLSIGLDLPDDLYFVVNSDGLSISVNRASTGALLDTLQIGNFNGSSAAQDIVNSLVVDPNSHTVYVGRWGTTKANSGIVAVSYTAAGVLDHTQAYNASQTRLVNGNQAGGITDVRYMDLSNNDHILYYTDNDNHYTTTPFSATNGIYRIDLTNPAAGATLLSSQTQFPTDLSNGLIGSVTADEKDGIIYFTTHQFSAGGTSTGQDALWWMPIGGGAATKISLPANALHYAGEWGGLSYDRQTSQLYISDQNDPSTSADRHIIQLQMSADGKSVTSTVNTSTVDTLVGHATGVNDPNAYPAGTSFDLLPIISVTGTTTHAAEQGATIDLTTGSTSVTDADNNFLASATVQITGGTFASNETSASDDHLSVNDGGTFKVSGSFTGTNITIGYDSATEKLTLSGADTLAHYQTVLNAVSYNTTGDNPTNYGNNASRTITWTLSDGAPNVPNGGQNQTTTTLNIDAVNDPPVNHLPGAQTANEDASHSLTGIPSQLVTDPDADPANQAIIVALSVAHGTLTVPTNVSGGLTSAQVVGSGTATVTLTATQNEINATLAAANGLVYLAAANYNGPDTLTVTSNDQGSTGSGGALQTQNTVAITVNAVNDAPAGADNTKTILEDNSYTFAAADFGFTDPVDAANGTHGADSFLAVKVTTLASAGTLTDNGVAVTAGQFVSLADITGNHLLFAPVANANGSNYSQFTFQVQDNGGTANGGVDTDQSPNTFTFNVTSVNDAPAGADTTKTINEDTAYTFAAADFGFTDPNDSPANNLLAVKITTLPGAGTLTDNGVAVTAGQAIAVADITGNHLVFTPAANANGSNYAHFTFQVQDDGGTANGGVDTDQSPNNLTFNVSSVNDAPAGADNSTTINEDTPYTFAATDFGFTDPNDNPANTLLAVKITTLPGAGTLTDNGVAVTVGQAISVADITGNHLVFTPAANASGASYASFTFQVQDNGGTANSGVDTDQSPNTFSFNVTSVNDAPAGADNTVTTNEDTPYVFATTDFGFADPNDNPANSLQAVEITTVPVGGSLTDNGVAVTAHQFISAADITAGLLQFAPAANANGLHEASLTFQVQDNGGTANGGVDTDPSPNTLNINVTAVNDAPAGADTTKTINEDTPYTFATTDFGFTDPNDSPANSLQAVKITTLSSAGTLTDNGVAVTAGQFVSAADIAGNHLVFTPAANANGASYASFTFQVQDDGGTANGGVDTDQSPNSFTFNVTSVNDAPAGADTTVATNVGADYTFLTADFGFSDPHDTPANSLLAVLIDTPPAHGTLNLNTTPVDFSHGPVSIAASDIAAGLLTFHPDAGFPGPDSGLTFQVQDDGGTANGGVDLDPSANTLTINVRTANAAPAGSDGAVEVHQDSPYHFVAADFGFTDPGDTPANHFVSVEITTGPTAGTLTDNGAAVTAGQFVAVADINAGLLVFAPAVGDAVGANYASLTFQVQDDGSLANGGANLDPTPNTLTIDIVGANHAPSGADTSRTINEDASYTFAAADFGFADPNDTPADHLLAVEVTSVPLAGTGTLMDNGSAVSAGEFVSVADINANKLVFTPAANVNGSPEASFTFQVRDDGGTAHGGADTDPSPKTFTFDVTSVNDAPVGTSTTVNTLEDTTYVFGVSDFGFTDPNDNPANNLQTVKITTLPGAGTLTDNGLAVTGGQFVSAADIAGGLLKFAPAANAGGSNYAHFTFQVQDDGGIANGGVNLDPFAKTLTINVTSVNDAPAGADTSRTINEDTPYIFAAADFGFTDPNDSPANSLQAVEITALPGAGTLTDNGVAVTLGQFVPVADITGSHLVFTPAANANGSNYSHFTFQVQDNGGTANGGVDTDQTPNTFTFNVTSVNDAPAGADNTVTTNEDTPYIFAAADFGFNDPNDSPANNLLAVKITTLPASGVFTDNGVGVTAGQLVSVADINSGLLQFTPAANANGLNYASLTFRVQDDGGTANGGVNLDPTAKTLTINVTSVNDAPAGADKSTTINEDTPYIFATTDFGFTDPNDSPANNLLAVKITTLPSTGTLTDNGVAVTAGQAISVADIAGNHLVFTPPANANGNAVSHFTFQVQDDGGTAHGGADTDQTPNIFTFNVTAVNDPPAGTDTTVTTLEDTPHTFTAADFGFTDPNDSPANNLLAVEITTVPVGGSLTDNNVAVTAGQFVSAADIAAGLLQFTPAANANGLNEASFTFQVQDDGGTANSGVNTDPSPNTLTVNVTPVNDAPVLANVTASATYAPGGGPVTLSPALTVNDVDDANLSSATVVVTSSSLFLGDVLAIDGVSSGVLPDFSHLSVTYNAGNGTLTLTGHDTLADYQAALQTVTFQSLNATPTNGGANASRTVVWQLNDGEASHNLSNPQTTVINLHVLDLDANDSTGTGTGFITAFTEQGGAVAVADTDVTINDVDATTMASATVTLTDARLDDSLGIAGVLPSGIISTVDASIPGRIALTLSGGASTAAYQQALQQVVFNNTSHNPDTSDRDVAIFVTDTHGISTNTADATIHVIAVNDPPAATIAQNYSATEHIALSLKGTGLAVSDVDDNGGIETATLTAGEGMLHIAAGDSGATVGGDGTSSVMITGNLAQINALLGAGGTSTLTYIENTGGASPTHLTLTIDDNGNTGTNGAQTGSATVTIDITPAAPTLVLAHDTGFSATDLITSDPTLNVTPAQAGGTLLFNVDGANGGAFSTSAPVFATNGSADGAHTVLVEQENSAGSASAPASLTFTLDTTAPHLNLNGITASPGSGNVFAGSTVEFVFAFNEAITVSGGTPTLSLDDGATAFYDPAATAALHDPTKLAFDYLVSPSDPLKSSLAVTGFVSHGATVADLAGNAATLNNVAATFPLAINEATIPAFQLGGGIIRPALILGSAGEIVLDATSAAFAENYGIKALYAGLPASTPYPPVDPQHDFHLSL